MERTILEFLHSLFGNAVGGWFCLMSLNNFFNAQSSERTNELPPHNGIRYETQHNNCYTHAGQADAA